MKRSIEKVSREEIAQASADFYAAQKTRYNSQNNESSKPIFPKTYVSRLNTKDIEDFFSKFGNVRTLYKYKDPSDKDYVFVDCETFETLFSDFDFAVIYHPNSTNNSTFDFDALVDYCNTTDLPVEQAIADMIAFDLMASNFPSYPEELEKQRNKKSCDAFSKLPKSVRMAMKTVHEKQLAENANVGSKGKFGTFNTDAYFRNTYGENN